MLSLLIMIIVYCNVKLELFVILIKTNLIMYYKLMRCFICLFISAIIIQRLVLRHRLDKENSKHVNIDVLRQTAFI